MAARTPKSPKTFDLQDHTKVHRRLEKMQITIDRLRDIAMEFPDQFWYTCELESLKNDTNKLLKSNNKTPNINKNDIKSVRNRLHIIAKKVVNQYNFMKAVNGEDSDDNFDTSDDNDSESSNNNNNNSDSNNSNNNGNSSLSSFDPYSDDDDEARKKIERINEEYRQYTTNEYFNIIKNDPNICLEKAILKFEKADNKYNTLKEFAERKGRTKDTYIDAFKQHYQHAMRLYAKNIFIKELEKPGWIW